jgi:hypothetical protein
VRTRAVTQIPSFASCTQQVVQRVPQVVQSRVKNSQMVPKGAQRCPHEVQLVPYGCQNRRINCGLGGHWGNTWQRWWVPGNLKIGGHSVLFFNDLRIGIRGQSRNHASVVTLPPVGGLSSKIYIYIYIYGERERERGRERCVCVWARE